MTWRTTEVVSSLSILLSPLKVNDQWNALLQYRFFIAHLFQVSQVSVKICYALIILHFVSYAHIIWKTGLISFARNVSWKDTYARYLALYSV